jgi:hypothetical protein
VLDCTTLLLLLVVVVVRASLPRVLERKSLPAMLWPLSLLILLARECQSVPLELNPVVLVPD